MDMTVIVPNGSADIFQKQELLAWIFSDFHLWYLDKYFSLILSPKPKCIIPNPNAAPSAFQIQMRVWTTEKISKIHFQF